MVRLAHERFNCQGSHSFLGLRLPARNVTNAVVLFVSPGNAFPGKSQPAHRPIHVWRPPSALNSVQPTARLQLAEIALHAAFSGAWLVYRRLRWGVPGL